MKFKVGDMVRVSTNRFGPEQFGRIGVIIQTDRPTSLNFRVKFEMGYNVYCETDLELCQPLLQPDFTLDEIASAQEIMDQMG